MPQTLTEKPIDRFLSHLKGYREYSRGYTARCPSHNDSEASLMIWEDETDGHVGLKCFSGCSRKAIVEAVGLTESDLYVSHGSAYHPKRTSRKIDILDLAIDKLVPPRALESFGLTDSYTWRTSNGKVVKNVVRIPYYLADGNEHTLGHVRLNLTAKEGTKAEGTGNLIPYGLNRIEEARKAGYIIIPEGESDCWTCWYHQIPALGVPGADNYNTLHADMLQGIGRVYIIREMTDEAGKAFPEKVVRRLIETGYTGTCYAVPLLTTHDAKDPNALLQKLFNEGGADRYHVFKKEMQAALDAAIPIQLYTDISTAQTTLEGLQPLVLDAIEKQDVNALHDLAEKITLLDTKSQVALTGIIKSGMKRGDAFLWSDFKKLLQEAKKRQQKAARDEQVYVSGKPQILMGRQLREEVDDALSALYKANIPPVFYVRSGNIVRCRTDENHKTVIESVNEHIMIERLTRVADFVTYNEQTDTYSSAHPTLKIAYGILSKGQWNFPPLIGITEVPIIRKDGTILDRPGYDGQSRYVYIPQPGLEIPAIPEYPTQEQVEDAAKTAFSFIEEFPYVGKADRANAKAAMITAVTRMLYRHVPMGIIDAKKAGTGKGLLATVLSLIHHGRLAATTTQPRNEEEWGKTLTSFVLKESTFISIDNVESILNSPKLASFLTNDEWEDRILGSNTLASLPQRSMVIANGNNITLGGDIPRRCYRICLDAGVSRPDKRDNFTYTPLESHVEQQRGKIIAALLTLCRAWYVAGRPSPEEKIANKGTFTEWAQIVGGILAYAGVDGFLANDDQMYEEADIEGTAWERFLTAWLAVFESREVTIADVVEALKSNQTFADTLPDALSSAMLNPNKAFNKVLSHALRKKEGTPYGDQNIKLCKGHDNHLKTDTWKVAVLENFAVLTQNDHTKNITNKNDSKNGVNRSVEPSHSKEMDEYSNGRVAELAVLEGIDSPQYGTEIFFSAHEDEGKKEEKNNFRYREQSKLSLPNTANTANPANLAEGPSPLDFSASALQADSPLSCGESVGASHVLPNTAKFGDVPQIP